MVQFIAITMVDGSLAVMQFITVSEADDEAIEAEITKAGLVALRWRRIRPNDLPKDRADRDAWTDDGKTIAVDPTRKAALAATKAEVP